MNLDVINCIIKNELYSNSRFCYETINKIYNISNEFNYICILLYISITYNIKFNNNLEKIRFENYLNNFDTECKSIILNISSSKKLNELKELMNHDILKNIFKEYLKIIIDNIIPKIINSGIYDKNDTIYIYFFLFYSH